MGREVKRVPLDFNYPLNKVWEGYSPTIERIKGIAGIFEKAPYLKECKSSWDICDKCDEIINCCSESAEHCIWYNKENKEEKEDKTEEKTETEKVSAENTDEKKSSKMPLIIGGVAVLAVVGAVVVFTKKRK